MSYINGNLNAEANHVRNRSILNSWASLGNIVNILIQLLNWINNNSGGAISGVFGNIQFNNNGAFGAIPNGTAGQVLISQGSSNPPAFGNFALTIQDAVPVTGGNVTSNGSSYLALNPAGTLATLTITAPTSPVNGQLFTINSTKTITSLTITGGTFQGVTEGSSFAGNNVQRWIYDSSQSQWLLN